MAQLELPEDIAGDEKSSDADPTAAVEEKGVQTIMEVREFVARETNSIKNVYGHTTNRSKFLDAEQMLSACLTQRRIGIYSPALQELQDEAFKILSELGDQRSHELGAFYLDNLEKLEQLRTTQGSDSI